MDERRKHKRKNVLGKVVYRIKTRFYELSMTSALRNVSMGGLSFFTSRFLKPGSRFEAFLQLPKGSKDIFSLCRVIWSKREEEEDNKHSSGAEFLSMTDEDRALLKRHMEDDN